MATSGIIANAARPIDAAHALDQALDGLPERAAVLRLASGRTLSQTADRRQQLVRHHPELVDRRGRPDARQEVVRLRCADPHALEREHQHRIAGKASQCGVQSAVPFRVGAAEHALGEQERVEAAASGLELRCEGRGQQGLGVQQGAAPETRGVLVDVLRKFVFAEHLVPQAPERRTGRLARFPDPNRAQHCHRIQARRRDVGWHVSVQRKVAEQVPQEPEAPVWDKNGDGIDVPLLYLARPDTDLHIEFPYQEA